LADLTWQSTERQAPLADEVEIEVQTVGLNFKDVLLALHRVSAMGAGLGVECAGQVVRVGPGVTQFTPGQRVLAMVPGSLSRFVCAPVATTAALPLELSQAAAATIPITFLTATYALESLANLQPGERVLIHAGTGGVGQAAIQIAQRLGAEVFATASQGKWQILKDLGVTHIFDSRTTAFESEILTLTQGQGVDVVLNSLRGEFTDASLRLLPPGGRFLEIGITDLRTLEQVENIAPGIAYYPIDLMDLYRDQRSVLHTLLQELMTRFAKEELRPLPYQLYSANAIETAFRTMQQAKHVGKVVIELDQSPVVVGDEVEIALRNQQSWVPRLERYGPEDVMPYSIHPEASYVLVGGLGGLGLLIIEDLVRRGARNIFVCGRSSPCEAVKAALEKMQENSTIQIRASQVDILSANMLEEWLESINTVAPIKGLFFLAGQLRDGLISKMSWPQFQEVLAVKTLGLSQVDQFSRKYSLDFFIAFSSLTAITGSPGQSNYVAANSFVDGLMQLRRTQGLPGNTIDWGPWKEAGMAQRLSSLQSQRLLELGILPLETKQSLQVLNGLGSQSPTQIGVMRIDWSKFLKHFPTANTNPLYEHISYKESMRLANVEMGSSTGRIEGQNWLEILLSTPQAQRNKRLLELLESAVNQVIGAHETESIGLRKPLFDLGLDSLTAVELKNRIEKNLQCVLSSTLLFDYPTLEALSEHLKTLISIPFAPLIVEQKNSNRVAITQGNEDLDEMSEEDLALMLAAKIKK
jgi:myxalamid-type polyketide synthase MxaB